MGSVPTHASCVMQQWETQAKRQTLIIDTHTPTLTPTPTPTCACAHAHTHNRWNEADCRPRQSFLSISLALLPTLSLVKSTLPSFFVSCAKVEARTFAAAAGLIDVPCPDFGAESVTEGTLMEWQKNIGDFVAKGELLASIETDKVTVDLTAPESGIVRELLLPNDGTAVKGSILLRLEPSAGSGAASAAPASSPAAPSAKSTPSPTAPAAAGELKGIRAGFAHAAMLRAQRSGKAPPAAPATAPAPKAAPAKAPAPSTAPTPMKIPSTGRGERRVPITPPRRQVISVLKESQNTAASLTTFQECDVGFAQDICKKHEDAFQKTYGAPLGLLSLFVKACSGALAEVPGVNGIIDEQTIRYRDYIDIGVPIPTPRGFVTCVLRNAETMSVPEAHPLLCKKCKLFITPCACACTRVSMGLLLSVSY